MLPILKLGAFERAFYSQTKCHVLMLCGVGGGVVVVGVGRGGVNVGMDVA